jgi:hypothetical protein
MSIGTLLFNGNNSIYCGANSILNLPGDFTIDFFAKSNITTPAASSVTIVNGPYSAGGDWVGITLNNTYSNVPAYNNRLSVKFWFGTGGLPVINGNRNVMDTRLHFISIQRSVGVISIYIDGVLDAQANVAVSPIKFDLGVYVGAYPNNTGGWNGYLANLRIVKGTALYSSNFTPPSANLTAVAGTVLLLQMANNAPFIDSSPNAIAFASSAILPVSSALVTISSTGYQTTGATDLISAFAPYAGGRQSATTGYQISAGVDLNTIFKQYVSGTQAATTGYQTSAGADLNSVFEAQVGTTWIAMGSGTASTVWATSAVDNSNVYVGGAFTNIGGDPLKKYIAKWNGTTWQAMGSGINPTVWGIFARDNSNVYVGGEFTDIGGDTNKKYIAKWNGTTWQAMGSGTSGSVRCIRAYDNSNVYVGGYFTDIGGDTNKKYIAKWNGTTWQAMGSGMGPGATGVVGSSGVAFTISAYDNSNVYVGGEFTDVGGDTNKKYIAKWDGQTWQRMGSGISSGVAGVRAISAVDNSNVYVGGDFTDIGGDTFKKYIAKWDGATWQRMDPGITDRVLSISSYDNLNVYVGGWFTDIGGDTFKKYIAKWDGTTWQRAGSGAQNFVRTINALDNANLYVGGEFTDVGGDTNKAYVAKWTNNYIPPKGNTWIAMGSGTTSNVLAISAYDNSNIYVGGEFTNIGGDTFKKYFAKWDGITWQRVDSGLQNLVTSIFARDNSNVYVGGIFTDIGGDTNKKYIAKWNGTTWQAMGSGTSSYVRTLFAKDNSNVYVGGYFPDIGGDTNKKYIAKWDGTTWQAMGSGMGEGATATAGTVWGISAYDNSNVYVGGEFLDVGGDTNKKYIAKWDGATWQRMGSGISSGIAGLRAISAVDNSNVYVGGYFTDIGGDTFKKYIAKWDGTTWQRVSSGLSDRVISFSSYDNSNVYVGGGFTDIGGDTFKSRIAKWDGTTWQRTGSGAQSFVNSISARDNANVYVGGYFTDVGGDTNKAYVAKWTNNYIEAQKGITWTAMGTGTNGYVWYMSAKNKYNIYVAGEFPDVGGDTNKKMITKWDGFTWRAMGSGATGTVLWAVSAVDELNVYVGGLFTNVSGLNVNNIAKWTGMTWQAMGIGTDSWTRSISAVDNSNVYAAGNFTSAGGVANTRCIAKWNGTAWQAMGTGTDTTAYAVHARDNSNVYVGGAFTSAGGVANTTRIAKWNGTAWQAMGNGVVGGSGIVNAITSVDNSNIYVGGSFLDVGGDTFKNRITRWDGTTWQRMGAGVTGTVMGITVLDNSNVYVGGMFPNVGGDTFKKFIVKWDGATWQAMGSGVDTRVGQIDRVNAIAALDVSNVYICGGFQSIGGDANKAYVAKWTNDY